MKKFTIGRLAREAGVNVETIRYYEKRRLIPEPPRRESGYRQYSPDYVRRIRFIKRAQELGFSLKEIGELLTLRVESTSVCSDIRKQAEAKINDIDLKMKMLARIKQTLQELVEACEENEVTEECPILAVLDTHQS